MFLPNVSLFIPYFPLLNPINPTDDVFSSTNIQRFQKSHPWSNIIKPLFFVINHPQCSSLKLLLTSIVLSVFWEHIEYALSKASAMTTKLLSLWELNLPPSPFYNFFRAIVEPDFIYSIESCLPYLTKTSVDKIDAMQLWYARISLGVTSTTPALLTLLELGQIHLSERFIVLILKFLVYALAFPSKRFIKIAVIRFIHSHEMCQQGWYTELLRLMGG